MAVVQHQTGEERIAGERLAFFLAFEVASVHRGRGFDFDAYELAQRRFEHKVHLDLVFVTKVGALDRMGIVCPSIMFDDRLAFVLARIDVTS